MTDALTPPTFRRRVAYQALLLGGIAMTASAALVLGDWSTRDQIAAQRAEDLNASLGQVIPSAIHDNELVADALTVRTPEGEAVRVYRARRSGQITAAAFEMVANGYAGDIVLVIGVDRDGRVLGVRVVKHAETPGLGDKIELRKAPWIRSFDGKGLNHPGTDGWAVKKDGGQFDQFTGATITPRAVVKAVHEGLTLFNSHRAEIIEEATP